jgi:hypothetical protein
MIITELNIQLKYFLTFNHEQKIMALPAIFFNAYSRY